MTEHAGHVDVLDSREAGGKVIRGGGLRVASYVLSLTIGLISAPLLINHLSLGDYGFYATVSSIAFVVGGLTEGGLGNVAMREYANVGDAERRSLIRALLGLRLSLVVVGVLLALLFTLVAGYPPIVTTGVAIYGAGILLGAAHHTYAIGLQAQLRLGWLSALDLTRQVGTTVLVLVFVLLGASLTPFFTVTVGAFALTLAATVWATRRMVDFRPEVDFARWRSLVRETAVYALATSLGVLYFQIAIISTSLLANETEAGLYGAAFRIVEIANGIPWVLATAAFPIVARAAARDAERLRYALQRLFETMVVCGCFFAVVIVAGAPFAMDVLGGDKLDPAIDVLRTLAIGVPCTFLIATWSFALVSLQRYWALAAANGAAVALALLLSVLLIPSEGAHGAAITTAALEIVLAAGYAIALLRADPELRPQLRVVPRAAVGVALALGVVVAADLPSVPATLAAMVLYAGVVIALRAVPPEIAEALRSRFARQSS